MSENSKAANGQVVTDEMINKWCEALDRDEWPEGEHSVGPIIAGSPRSLSPEGTTTLSVKIPVAMKRAIERKAENESMSTSELVRSMLAGSLMS